MSSQNATSIKQARLECLYDVVMTGSQNALATGVLLGKDANINRTCNRGEWFEIKWLEIISPLKSTGAGDQIASYQAIHRWQYA